MSSPQTIQEFHHPGLDPRIRCFRAGEEVDTFVVVTERLLVYVDTMSTPELMRQVVEAASADVGARQVMVLNTHADWDHVYGNSIFGGREQPGLIVASEATAARLHSDEARAVLAHQQEQDARFSSVTLTPPHLTFPSTLTLDGGDLTLHLFPTPGHRADHVSVWIPEVRTLLAGDAAEYPWPCIGTYSDLDAMRASLERMIELDPAFVLPCHGGTSSPDLTARNLAYLDRLATLVKLGPAEAPALTYEAALAWLGTTPDAVPSFYRDFHQDAVEATQRWLASREG
jgi:glyoxylase-like metal-dependent hydrolase (beta-lactamase superfamily II)